MLPAKYQPNRPGGSGEDEIWLHFAQWFQRRSHSSKVWTDDGGFPCYKLPFPTLPLKPSYHTLTKSYLSAKQLLSTKYLPYAALPNLALPCLYYPLLPYRALVIVCLSQEGVVGWCDGAG